MENAVIITKSKFWDGSDLYEVSAIAMIGNREVRDVISQFNLRTDEQSKAAAEKCARDYGKKHSLPVRKDY